MIAVLFFERSLYFLYNNYQAQTYYGLVLYLFLAVALCCILAVVAYLFSLSSVQDSEKRSEYECGFEPFDSATRLPFDVHFYLVGILFLVFDVEIALLFPWVLSLRTSGWFGFYLMLGFIIMLAIGFLYEWKRGALIWPSRQHELKYNAYPSERGSMLFVIVSATDNPTILAIGLCLVAVSIFSPASAVKPKSANSVTLPGTSASNQPKLLELVNTSSDASALAEKVANTATAIKNAPTVIAEDYLANMALLRQRFIPLYRRMIKYSLLRVQTAATKCRDHYFYDEALIASIETKAFNNLEMATVEYTKLKTLYITLRKSVYSTEELANVCCNIATRNKLIAVLSRRAEIARQSAAVKTSKLRRQATNLNLNLKQLKALNAQVKSTAAALEKKIAPIENKIAQYKAEALADMQERKQRALYKRSTPLMAIAPSTALTFVDDYTTQFVGQLLPELGLTIILCAVLTLLSVGLGRGQSKKALALESLDALQCGLMFTLAAYGVQLLFTSGAVLFNGYALTSSYIVALKMLTLFSGRFILLSSRSYVQQHSRHLLEYPATLTLATLFMLLLISSGHLISAFLALVGFSLNLYVLILFDATSAVAREAGVKYFYLSTISSGLMLYGIFLIFLIAGTGHFLDISQVLSIESELTTLAQPTLQLAITLLLVGLFFKLSAFPGHLWAAEVYEGSPDPIMAFFMLPVKIAVLSFLLQLLATAFEPAAALWQPLIAVSAAASLIWGCLAALAERKTKRFLAYASINQIGFLLLGVATGTFEGYVATLFYLLVYTIMNTGFLVVFLQTRRADGANLTYLTDFRGLGQQYPQYSWSIAMILLSMAGIPPLAGFFGKYYLLLHAQEQELYGLVITGLLASLVSTYYYLRVIKILWFEGREGMSPVVCSLSPAQALTLKASEWSLWAFIIYCGPVMQGLDSLVEALFTLTIS